MATLCSQVRGRGGWLLLDEWSELALVRVVEVWWDLDGIFEDTVIEVNAWRGCLQCVKGALVDVEGLRNDVPAHLCAVRHGVRAMIANEVVRHASILVEQIVEVQIEGCLANPLGEPVIVLGVVNLNEQGESCLAICAVRVLVKGVISDYLELCVINSVVDWVLSWEVEAQLGSVPVWETVAANSQWLTGIEATSVDLRQIHGVDVVDYANLGCVDGDWIESSEEAESSDPAKWHENGRICEGVQWRW